MLDNELCPDNFRDVKKTLVMQDFFSTILAFKIFSPSILG